MESNKDLGTDSNRDVNTDSNRDLNTVLNMQIGMWGPAGSGKSTYLTMLQFADRDGWKFRPKGAETHEIYLEYTDCLRDKLEFVPANVKGNVHLLQFDFEYEGNLFERMVPKRIPITRKQKVYHVVIPESAGEHYENPREAPSTLITTMQQSQAVIWLIDPFQLNHPESGRKSYKRMIQEWLYILYGEQPSGKLDKYFAFCLTKMDHPDYVEFIDEPESYCLERLGEDIILYLKDFCDTAKIEFFSTSSAGFDEDTGASTVDPENPSKLKYPANPYRLFEPFRWLFKKLDHA